MVTEGSSPDDSGGDGTAALPVVAAYQEKRRRAGNSLSDVRTGRVYRRRA
jgi:hypothetical protein